MKVLPRKRNAFILKRGLINAKQKSAFTLIELLVVTFIIAVLVSIATASFSQVQKKGRNGKRESGLHLIATALELYRQNHGFYPTTYAIGGAPFPQTTGLYPNLDVINCLLGSPAANLVSYINYTCGLNSFVSPPINYAISPFKVYIPKIPTDPIVDVSSTSNNYAYLSDGQTYTLLTRNYEGVAPSDHVLGDPGCAGSICIALDGWGGISAAVWNKQYVITSKDN